MRGRIILSLMAVFLLALGVNAYSQSYPTKPGWARFLDF